MNSNERYVQMSESSKIKPAKKISLLITLIYFVIFGYIAFFHHPYWFEPEGLMYLNWGNDLVFGNSTNVHIPDAPVGWPIIHSTLTHLFGDGFLIGKIVALLSATGIVFLSFYVIRNIFGDKVAIIGQLFFAVNPRLNVLSVEAMNELLPVFLIMISFYFLTKKIWNSRDIMFAGLFLGISATMRFQAILILIPTLIFLLIKRKPITFNLKICLILGAFFILGISPLLLYNISTFDTILENDSSQYMIWFMKYQTPEWRTQMIEMELSDQGGLFETIMLDPQLFFKNYFYNLFFHNSSHLFNFGTLSNMSVISLIPYVSIILVFGGLFDILKINKKDLKIIGIFIVPITTVIFIFGEFSHHFFLLIIGPIIPVILIKLRKINENFAFFIILALVYLAVISIVPLKGPYQLLPMWISIVMLSSIFLVETLPNILKNCFKNFDKQKITYTIVITVSIILFLQIGFSYKLLDTVLYDWNKVFEEDIQQADSEKILEELENIFVKENNRIPSGFTYYEIGKVLSKQPNIENSFVMAKFPAYAYYAGSKFIHTHLQEGNDGDSLIDFVNRKNWSEIDVYNSNMFSYPNNKYNSIEFTPDYFIIEEQQPGQIHRFRENSQINDLNILLNPDNPNIPSNFEFIYKSNYTNTVLYKINPSN